MRDMLKQINIFTKIVILILGLLILMMVLFAVYNQTSVQVINSEIKTINLNKLMFLKSQLEEKFNQISINAITLSNDAAIKQLEYEQMSGNPYDRQKLLNMIADNISLQSGITGWLTEITVYSRLTHEIISTSNKTIDFDDPGLVKEIQRGWQFKKAEVAGETPSKFEWYSVTPITAYEHPETARLIVKTSFSTSYLQDMLDQYKLNGQGDPFLYHPQAGIIANRKLSESHAKDVVDYLNSQRLESGKTNFSVNLNGHQYLMSYVQLQGPGWYLVDYLPMEEVLAPVTKSRNLFYFSSIILLVFSVIAAYILYRNVQVPVRELVRHVQRIKRGDYSSRVRMEGGSEFSFLFHRFNEMAETIQDLLEKVYEERIRSREAILKQLQSQINPHFLYNCLFYIKNMARLGDEDSVVAMALNLGEYFRYTTRLGKQTAILQEELEVVVNYLEIQNMRMKRIAYRVDIPEPMKKTVIPRLILQPIIENAVIHGIEPKDGKGDILIRGEIRDLDYRIVVEDNGVGMSEEKLAELQTKLDRPENDNDTSFGLWNVNQRLKLMFAEGSGLYLARSPAGGLAVTVILRPKKEADTDVSIADRG